MAAEALTAKRRAACRIVLPPSTTRTIRSRRSWDKGAVMINSTALTPSTLRIRSFDSVQGQTALAAHLPDGIDARTTVAAQVATSLGDKRFAVSGSVIKAPGWRAVYGAEADEDVDSVPGKAKPDSEPTIGRMPLIQDGEPGTATEARVETAQTEPPRRITRGELPVVMGRLIDQVDDPKLKAALENPANPNEPKGLGTAATRDTILPKLLKS